MKWTGGQYSIYRAVFGIYLFVHFVMLLPWAGELFSHALPAAASPLLRAFPNVLAVWDAPAVLIAIAVIASVFFAIGLFDRVAAVVLWYVLACLFGRNPLIAAPRAALGGAPHTGEGIGAGHRAAQQAQGHRHD